jgi:sugar lactone lactonase YvrE
MNRSLLRHWVLSVVLFAGFGFAAASPGVLGWAEFQQQGPAGASADEQVITIANVGFETPESVLHDERADVYLVSNIHGNPTEKDNNGFISRISPTGDVIDLRWIQGGQKGVTLHAPKGLAIRDSTLFVADIDCVRRFNRETGAAEGEWCVPAAVFLNDVAVGPDGTLYVTDSGFTIGPEGIKAAGADAVYRFDQHGKSFPLSKGPDLNHPNGIVADKEGVIVVSFGAAQVYRLDPKGLRTDVVKLPAGQLDGVVRLDDGTLLVSSWEGQAIYRVSPDRQVATLVEGIPSPADIGYDRKRRRVLVPVFMENRVEIRPFN